MRRSPSGRSSITSFEPSAAAATTALALEAPTAEGPDAIVELDRGTGPPSRLVFGVGDDAAVTHAGDDLGAPVSVEVGEGYGLGHAAEVDAVELAGLGSARVVEGYLPGNGGDGQELGFSVGTEGNAANVGANVNRPLRRRRWRLSVGLRPKGAN